jgi:chemotaxis-related protein WspB
MLFLLFKLGSDRYALEASRVVEVLPLLELKRVPHAPPAVAGIFNYRGHPVPALDLCQMTLGRPAALRLSTRIILVNCPDARGRLAPVGLVAEHATGLLRREPGDFVIPHHAVTRAPYLGPLLMDGAGPIQCLYEDRLISDPLRALVFSGPPTSHERG